MKTWLLACIVCVTVALQAQTYPGNFTGKATDGSTLVIKADTSTVRITFFTPDILNIQYLPSPHSIVDSSFVVVQHPNGNVQVVVQDTDSSFTISSSRIQILCRKYPLRFSFADSSGRVLLEEPSSGGLFANGEARGLRCVLHPHDHFYGTGERGTSLDKRGQAFESYNRQVGGYSTPLATMNLNVPFIATPNGYAIYIDNTYKGQFDFGATDSTTFSCSVAGGELSYFLIAARTIPEQLEKYTWLTGRQPLPPQWAFGFIQSKNRYQNETEARSIVRTMRERHFPCDALVLDLAWFKNMGDVAWNDSLWPHHEKMVGDFLKQGIKTILITEPYIVQPSLNFNEARSMGYLAKDSAGGTYLLDKWWSCGGCNASLLDLTNPAAQQWWWNKHVQAFGKSVAGIWTDLGEPERHPDDVVHHLGSATKIHNIFNLLWAKIIFEGLSNMRPGERVFNLTRSGFAGSQRYGVIPWSGDVARSFGGLAVQMPMLLNMGMSGLAYHNSDIGGYSRIPTTPELYVRWMEYGTFCPITRAHGAGEVVHGSATEPWQFGPEAETICRTYIQLRYRLLPYIYSMAHQNYKSGLPLARPLLWVDPDDAKLPNESSSYMWGDAFLVSPVVQSGETTKTMYLPRGAWVNYWTDEHINGGDTITVAAPLDRMPLFVKAGSIIPMGPVMDYSNERPLDTLTLRVYPTEGETSTMLYEDDGHTLEYQQGQFSTTTFTQNLVRHDSTSVLTLTTERSVGEYKGKLKERTCIYEVHGLTQRPVHVQCNGVEIRERSIQRADSYYYDATAHTVSIRAHCETDRQYRIVVSGRQ